MSNINYTQYYILDIYIVPYGASQVALVAVCQCRPKRCKFDP